MRKDRVQVQMEREHMVPVRKGRGRGGGMNHVGGLALDDPMEHQWLVFTAHLLHAKHPCISFKPSLLKLCKKNKIHQRNHF